MLLVVLAVGIVAALYMWIVYAPDMSVFFDDNGFNFEELSFDGDGSSSSPFLIRTAEDLAELAEKVNNGSSYRENYFVLMNDIDLTELLSGSGEGWLPIGSFADNRHFGGVFDGAGHTVSGLWLNRPDLTGAGLFGYMRGAEVYRLHVEAASITAQNNAAALVGYFRDSVMISCSASIEEISVSGSNYFIIYGILAGYVKQNSRIEQSSARGELEIIALLSSSSAFGGIAGIAEDKTVIRRCSVDIDVTVESLGGLNIGGITGGLLEGSIIEDSSASGRISINSGSHAWAGGLAGCAGNTGTAIRNSSAAVDISGAMHIGGFIGWHSEGAEIINSRASGAVIITGDEEETFAGGGFTGVSDGDISRSYFDGAVIILKETEFWAGGFVGYQSGGVITDCYSTGNIFVEADDPQWHDIGGFIGSQGEDAVIRNSYFAGVIENPSSRTREFVMEQSGVIENCYPHDADNFDGFDFINVWFMPEGESVPRLW